MKTTSRIVATTLIAVGMAAFAPLTFAQSSQQAMQSASQSASKPPHFSDSQVQTFAKAESKVRSVRSQWESKLKNSKDKKTAMSNRRKAMQAMVKAVKSTGMSVSQYNKIAKAAQSNPKLAKRIQQMG